MTAKPIDVWDVSTFDRELTALLRAHEDLIRDYTTTDHHIFRDYDLGQGKGPYLYRSDNPHGAAFLRLKETVGQEMEGRTIRAFHYTRLTDVEVEGLLKQGIHPSTPDSLRTRLNSMVTAGHLTTDRAAALYKASPFHGEQLEARDGKFWMTSYPHVVDDPGVVRLMRHWGGEVASWFLEDDDQILAPLSEIGKPRIIEVAVPLALTRRSYSAGEAIIAAFGRYMGLATGKHDFDLYTIAPLEPSAILKVHGEWDASFAAMGRGYPRRYVAPDTVPTDEDS
ncbi:hypothetical protein [Sabulicella glaciei]|uniref:Uncharacterized protein n=1 Tax=Sabulicella glaciei TaxID=2984948 RepID=A0ABT3P1D9_9PROT|nr:hypothetical protein [Roseococcus sp. MDT2-1-1]MCW8088245.1 hypothetical protein [Roseococcus sp. MDT2-1-1]